MPLILVCIVAFGAASAVGFVLQSSAVQMLETTVPQRNFNVHRFAEAVAKNYRVRGDPINDPRPN